MNQMTMISTPKALNYIFGFFEYELVLENGRFRLRLATCPTKYHEWAAKRLTDRVDSKIIEVYE